MRAQIVAVAVVATFLLIAATLTWQGAFMVAFGWIPFLNRVIPAIRPDGPTAFVGLLAFLLFAVGIHAGARAWWRTSKTSTGEWPLRWTFGIVAGVFLLFAAGISMIGITHQISWLATSEKPVLERPLAGGNGEWERGQLGRAISETHSGGTVSANGEALHSWETHLLSYLFYACPADMNQPWSSEGNQKYFKCVIPEFINPAFGTDLEDFRGYGLSHYAANSRVMLPQIVSEGKDSGGAAWNGNSNTILVGEVNSGFKPWGDPVNWRDPGAGLNRGPRTFGGAPGVNGATFLMADGSVRFLTNETDIAVLRSLGGRVPE